MTATWSPRRAASLMALVPTAVITSASLSVLALGPPLLFGWDIAGRAAIPYLLLGPVGGIGFLTWAALAPGRRTVVVSGEGLAVDVRAGPVEVVPWSEIRLVTFVPASSLWALWRMYIDGPGSFAHLSIDRVDGSSTVPPCLLAPLPRDAQRLTHLLDQACRNGGTRLSVDVD